MGTKIYVTGSTPEVTWDPITFDVNDNTWYHVTVTWHANVGLLVYFNGRPVGLRVGRARARPVRARGGGTQGGPGVIGPNNDQDQTTTTL